MMFLRSSGVEGESNIAWGDHLQLSTIIVIPYHQHLDYHYHHPQHTDFFILDFHQDGPLKIAC